MGKFEQSIPAQIDKVEKSISDLNRERSDINWGHECDCEFCDRDGEEADPEADEKAAEIDKKIAECRATIGRLERHAKLHGIKLEGKEYAKKT